MASLRFWPQMINSRNLTLAMYQFSTCMRPKWDRNNKISDLLSSVACLTVSYMYHLTKYDTCSRFTDTTKHLHLSLSTCRIHKGSRFHSWTENWCYCVRTKIIIQYCLKLCYWLILKLYKVNLWNGYHGTLTEQESNVMCLKTSHGSEKGLFPQKHFKI